jgi:hypothetical protein
VDVHLLIDAIVRQTTVLIAQLATTAGARATLAHTANQVFIDLVRELREQGLGAKVIADMFGLSLRTYHNTVRRLSEGNTVRGQSLWEAVLEYIRGQGTVLRTDVLARFSRDDDALVRSVLKDLVGSGVLFQTGRGNQLAYRVARPEEFAGDASGSEAVPEALINFLWVSVYRRAPVRFDELAQLIPNGKETLEVALSALLADQRIARVEIGGVAHYTSERCVIPIGAGAGWEAAVFDHYQALVTAITAKLRLGSRTSEHSEAIGGSTYSCDVWDGHPLQQEALSFLQRCRERGADLVRRVDAYNVAHTADPATRVRVYAYVGQSVVRESEEEESE